MMRQKRDTGKPMIILGIDPGIAHTGHCVLRCEGEKFTLLERGLVVTHPPLTEGERLHIIMDGLQALAVKYKPDVVAVEASFFLGKSVRGDTVSMVRAVVKLVASDAGAVCVDVSPSYAKKRVFKGRASKEEVCAGVCKVLGDDSWVKGIKPSELEHVSDAIAIGISSVMLLG